jgi:hypothetical protein
MVCAESKEITSFACPDYMRTRTCKAQLANQPNGLSRPIRPKFRIAAWLRLVALFPLCFPNMVSLATFAQYQHYRYSDNTSYCQETYITNNVRLISSRLRYFLHINAS